MSSRRRSLLFDFALLGLVASSASSYVHFKLLSGGAYESFCDVNASVSCTQAYASEYGSLLGVPVAIWGVLYFAVILSLAGLPGRRDTAAGDAAAAYIFVLSTVGVAFSLYLAWASYVVLGLFCMLCAATYLSTIAVLILSRGATTLPITTLPRRATRDVRTLITSPSALILVVLLAAAAAAAMLFFPRQGAAVAASAQAALPTLTPEQRTNLETWWGMQPKVDLPVPKTPGVRVQILTFSDYQCPGCRAAHDMLKPVMAKYDKGVVEVVLKHYPLEPECNSNVPNGNHLAACEAAAAYVMARGTGFQQKLDDWLFDHQRDLTRDVVRGAAKDIAGIADFDSRYAQALQEVRADAGLGGLLNVRYTPTIYLNGRMIAGTANPMLPPQAVDALIEMELKAAK